MGRIKDYWNSTKYYLEWDIFYRNRPTGSIFTDKDTPFKKLNLDKKYWGADPLLFKTDHNYLFFELFDKKENKGKIACVNLDDGINDIKVVLDEKIHLSFPFVFEKDYSHYMIPETSNANNLVIYKCTNFPLIWNKETALLEGKKWCDTIVFNGTLVSSLMNNSASICSNEYYEFRNNSISNKGPLFITKSNNVGIRNAGPFFEWDNKLFRVGQNCENNQYGVGLVFWEILNESKLYIEKEYRRISIEDISIVGDKNQYSGIHTYSSNKDYEFIDLRIKRKRLFISRLLMFVKKAFLYIFKKR